MSNRAAGPPKLRAMLKVYKMLIFPVALTALFIGLVALSWQTLLDGRCSPLNECIANLKQLEAAKTLWALDHDKETNGIPLWSDLVGKKNYFPIKRVCPKGGTYTIGAVGEIPRCSVPDHVLP